MATAEAGIIEKIELKDFMCHRHFELSLGPEVNFIVGQNGSGKSAILVAITLCLGASAKFTNRSQKQADLVRRGANKGIVRVTLKNEGTEAYNPQTFGTSITIEKRIQREGASTLLIMDQHAKTVSKRAADLRLILEHFNIQIDNPCSILMQDTSREFLASAAAKKKYELFLTATQLKQIREDFETIEKNIKEMQSVLGRKQSFITDMRDEVDRAKKELDDANKLESIAGNIESLKLKLAWSKVVAKERELSGILKEQKKFEEGLKAINKKKEVLEHDMKAITVERTETDKMMEDTIQKIEIINNDKKTLHEQRSVISKEHNVLLQRIEALTRSERSAKNKKNLIERHMKEVQESKMNRKKESRERRDSVITKKADELLRRQDILESKKVNLESKQGEVNQASHAVQELDRQYKTQARQHEEARKQIQQLKERQSNRDIAFGKDVPTIRRIIDNNASLFSAMPIGPIGLRISVIDPKWTKAVEHAITSNYLDSYIVSDMRDASTLRNLLRNERSIKVPNITVQKFREHPYRNEELHLPGKLFTTAYSMIKVDNPNVINVLIDNQNIERKILVENQQDADRTFVHANPRNPNIIEAIDRDGVRYQLRNNVQSIITPTAKPLKLAPSSEEQLRHALELERNLDTQVKETYRQFSVAKDRLNTLKQEFNKENREIEEISDSIKSLDREIFSLKAQNEAEDKEEEQEPTNLEELEESLREVTNELTNLAKNMLELKEQSRASSSKLDPILKAIEAKDKEVDIITKETEALEAKILRIEKINASMIEATRTTDSNKEKYQSKVAEAASKAEALEKEIEEATASASEVCPDRVEISENEIPEALKRKIEQLTKTLKAGREGRRPIEEVIETYQRITTEYRKKFAKLEEAGNFLEEMKATLSHRQQTWENFRDAITERTNQWFVVYLTQKGYSGKLVFDHQKETLDVQVQISMENSRAKEQTNTKSLSGGEKSFATVSLLLALWEQMEMPFCAMDEFDVFMDAVNRKISIDMLITSSNRNKSRQHIFITPQNASTIRLEHQHVRVHQMLPPDRGERDEASDD